MMMIDGHEYMYMNEVIREGLVTQYGLRKILRTDYDLLKPLYSVHDKRKIMVRKQGVIDAVSRKGAEYQPRPIPPRKYTPEQMDRHRATMRAYQKRKREEAKAAKLEAEAQEAAERRGAIENLEAMIPHKPRARSLQTGNDSPAGYQERRREAAVQAMQEARKAAQERVSE